MESELAAQEQSRPRRRSRRASGLSAGGAAEPSADTPGPGPDGRNVGNSWFEDHARYYQWIPTPTRVSLNQVPLPNMQQAKR
ncbi:neuroepithelial cell-transforming gene 1 protein-like isoform X2 [Physeter macrocephalus]|uniref:Neuroepithelial cell-transforming gene 1 protein-like isoform X2 n=1 Tax=Physeter macrocephalus TaxID=9755 RepID=A0A455C2Z0_PHYMC|nr:neuroepithelial cell-transforming gene 1 protein-like isoform X2 [Physeter catodon]|eukprot:XP_028350301.1 neuroepithelial cell-transforming gene 1 protein-like isoform X3 [Physeter catodon]